MAQDRKIGVVQDFAQAILGYEELWELLTGREVKRIEPRVLRASGNIVLIDKNGYKIQKFEYTDWKVKCITVSNGRAFITVAYSGYEPIAENIVTRRQKIMNIDTVEYGQDKFVSVFREIYPSFTLDEINSYKQQKDSSTQKKKLLVEQIHNTLRQDYICVNEFYELNCKVYVHQFEYRDIRQKFVQNWIRNNLGNTPDLEQSLAIGSVNSHVQVVARAGSGKTSTLVNRTIFLQRHCGIKSSEILLLAFNRKAAQEIRERLQNDLPYAMTFHALAYALVRPDETLVYNETGGQQAQSRLIQSVINDYLRDSVYYERIKSLMIRRFKTEWFWIDRGEFNLTPQEKLAARRTKPQMGVDGVTYKSIGEKFIADFLFECDIPFIYERNFWWGYGEERTNYHPDFTILKKVDNKKGIVIEYFGLQGDPNYDQQS